MNNKEAIDKSYDMIMLWPKIIRRKKFERFVKPYW